MVISKHFQAVLALLLSLAWLIPNHVLPWLGFHGDAWIAIVLSVIALVFCFRTKFKFDAGCASRLAMALSTIPLVQYFFGQVLFFGIAWINFIYLFSFAVVMGLATAWRRRDDRGLIDLLLWAIIVASVTSVLIQIVQLLRLDYLSEWILRSPPSRQYANLAQPNHLSSLLMLGVVGLLWFVVRKKINIYIGLVIALFLMFGVALTESRTAWLVLVFLLGLVIWRRKVFTDNKPIYVVVSLAILFALIVLKLDDLYQALGFDQSGGQSRSVAKDPRWQAWSIFLKAAMLHPLVGYGFGQNAIAQFAVLESNLVLGGSYLQSHNLFLDFILWVGLPAGIVFSLFLLKSMLIEIFQINSVERLALVSLIGVLGLHSMLEYPLHYAYFLLPLGVFAGTLAGQILPIKKIVYPSYHSAVAVMFCVVALSVTISDYLRVERSFYGLRFELKKILTDIPKSPPDVLALSQWRENIRVSRLEVEKPIDQNDFLALKNVTTVMPSAFLMSKLATAFAVSGAKEEAFVWLNRVCQTSPPEHCDLIRNEWAILSIRLPEARAVKFPDAYK
jgi:hypothetical protein